MRGDKKRPVIYDTTTYVRQNVDIRQAVLFGIAAFAFGLMSVRIASPPWDFASSITSTLVVYFAVMALPVRAKLLTLLAYSTLFFVAPERSPETLRIIVFALLATATSTGRFSLSPFFAVIAAWAMLITAGLSAKIHIPHFSVDAPLIKQALIELFGLLLLHFLLWSNRVSAFLQRTPRAVDTRSILSAMCLVAVMGASYVTVRAVCIILGVEISEFFKIAAGHPELLLISASAIILTPLLIGFALNQLVSDFVSQLAELSDPSKRLYQPSSGLPTMREFKTALANTRSIIDRVLKDQRESQITIKELQHKAEQREQQIARREQEARNLEELLNVAPIGYIAVTGAGGVITVNDRFFELVGIEKRPLIGAHFSAIAEANPWSAEVATALAWAVKEFGFTRERKVMRCFASVQQYHFLDMELQVLPAASLSLDEKRLSSHLSNSDVVVTLFLRKLPDLREMALRLMTPSTLDLVGHQAVELCRKYRRELLSLAAPVAQAVQAGAALAARADLPEAGDVTMALRDVDRFLEKSVDELEELLDALVVKFGDVQNYDLGHFLDGTFRHLYEVLALDEQIPVTLDLAGAKDMDSGATLSRVMISAPPTEFFHFLSALAATVHSILPRASAVAVSVGYESIGAGTATIVPGSQPGQYARIVLHHEGQSITANMITDSIREIDPHVPDFSDTEQALAVLSIHVQRMLGFLSVQSSSSKGTTITIYLPERPELHDKKPKVVERITSNRPSAPAPLAPALEALGGSKKVLVAGGNIRVVGAVETMLRSLDVDFAVEDPFAPFEDEDDEFSFGGAGFGEAHSSNGALRLKTDASQFDTVIIEATANLGQIKDLFQQLRSDAPKVPVLVLGSVPAEEVSEIEPPWLYLQWPTAADVVRRALTRLFSAGN